MCNFFFFAPLNMVLDKHIRYLGKNEIKLISMNEQNVANGTVK